MTASVAILTPDNKVRVIYSGSTPEAVMLNVAEDDVIVENPPEHVEGGLKFQYDPEAETFTEI